MQTVTSADALHGHPTSFLDTNGQDSTSTRLAWRLDVRWLHHSAAGARMKKPSAPGHCAFFEIDFIHALLTRHMQCLSHSVMLNVCLAIISESYGSNVHGLASPSTDPAQLRLIPSV